MRNKIIFILIATCLLLTVQMESVRAAEAINGRCLLATRPVQPYGILLQSVLQTTSKYSVVAD
jgi:hypothetical protein